MYTEIFNVRDKKANLGFLINVFCIFLSVIFAAYYAFIRMDLGLDVEIFFKSVSFSIVMILLPLITSNVKHAIGNKTLLFQGFYTLSIIIILAIPGYFGVSNETKNGITCSSSSSRKHLSTHSCSRRWCVSNKIRS